LAVAERVGRGGEQVAGDLTYTPRALAVFSSALSSALAMGHNYIGTEHLLLGLARGDGVAAAVLRDGGLTQEMVAREIENKLARYVDAGAAAKGSPKRTAPKPSASNKARPARKARRR
jgi:ATP-dependent Clp protease ATP-binding subunit ClpC